MKAMFKYSGRSSQVFTLDLGDKFDTSNVTNMWAMFSETGYSSLVFTLDLGDKFDTSSVTVMNGTIMFNGSNESDGMFSRTGYSNPNFTLDLGDKFDTSNITSMYKMFDTTGYSNNSFELDLSAFDFSNVTNATYMFYNWKTTKKIYVKEATDQSWIINNAGNSNLTTSNVLIKT